MKSTSTSVRPSSNASASKDAASVQSASVAGRSGALPVFVADREAALPLHRQIEQWLRQLIEQGVLAPGAMLPARKEMRDIFGGINHLTIRKAIAALQDEGLLFSVQGSGTFVADKSLKPLRIALVLPNLDDELTHTIVSGVYETFELRRKREKQQMAAALAGAPAAAHTPDPDVDVVIFDSRRDVEKEIRNIAQLEDLPLDGAIVLPVSFGDIVDQLVRLKADRFPAVLLAQIQELRFNSVATDDYAGGYAITEHVLTVSGRRRVAWIGNRNGHFSDVQRYSGYRDALNDQGIACDRKLVCDLDVESPVAPFAEALGRALDYLLDGKSGQARPDAIVCANDFLALACIEELAARGLSVPGDIAVTGFDNISAAAKATPALTTVANPMRDLGRMAAELILEVIQNPEARARTLSVPVSLVVRDSA